MAFGPCVSRALPYVKFLAGLLTAASGIFDVVYVFGAFNLKLLFNALTVVLFGILAMLSAVKVSALERLFGFLDWEPTLSWFFILTGFLCLSDSALGIIAAVCDWLCAVAAIFCACVAGGTRGDAPLLS